MNEGRPAIGSFTCPVGGSKVLRGDVLAIRYEESGEHLALVQLLFTGFKMWTPLEGLVIELREDAA